MLKLQMLASGSGGNAVYISSGKTSILVDVGLSMPRLLKRLDIANIDPSTIDAVLVTHEHTDHVIGLESFMKRFPATLHVHTSTVDIFSYIQGERISVFDAGFDIGDIRVTHFPVPHDSKFCFGYTFTNGDAKVSIATDLGRVTEDILTHMAGSQLVVIECNHDLLRLTGNKKYPLVLKRRITGSFGHLSNPSCALAVYRLAQTGVSQVILAHLSEENNSPNLAYNFVKDFLGTKGIIEGQDIWIDVALQDEPSKRFELGAK
ncbi:MAG: MBL fold metallo-hydrolase [Christensenellaceae bacterium]|nr:MBL fold metallo-hydrolase [Christensenellaceae bacterium]